MWSQLSGYYDMSGSPEWALASGGPQVAGYLDLVPQFGAAPEMQYAPRPNPAAFPHTAAPMSGLRIRETEPKQGRVFTIGLKTSSSVAAAASATANANPQDPFAVRKVIVPATVAPNFEITDIKVGSISQLASPDPIPAEAFIPDSVNCDVRFDTAQIAQTIQFAVTNISSAAAIFRAALNGFTARQ